MLLRNTSLRPLLLCFAGFLTCGSAQAGVIPWTYNAVFGYGPAAPGWGGGMPFGGYAGYGSGWGGGYPMAGYYGGGYGGYPAGGYGANPYAVSYGAYPSYAGYPTAGACSSCSGGVTLNYAPGCNVGCNTCDTGCSNCSGTSTYSPVPENETGVEPTPATPPKDDFQSTTPRDNDADEIRPTDAPEFERPARPPATFGDESGFPMGGGNAPAASPMPAGSGTPAEGGVAPSGGETTPADDIITPSGGSATPGSVNPFLNQRNRNEVDPLDIEPAVAATTAPIRRRTAFTTGFRVPTVVRVAVTPAPRHSNVPQVATK